MNPLWPSFPIVGLALGLTACTIPRKEAASTSTGATTPAQEKKPAYKKPVRMNGRGKVTSISFEEFYVLQESGKAVIYDARPGIFYSLGHIPGAISLPLHGSDEKIAAAETQIKAALAEGKTLIVYCTSTTCPDARSLAIHFSGFGYPVTVFSGGWDAWKDAGMPTQ